MIPTVDFFGTQVSRVLLGDNPFNGHSYIQAVHSGQEMLDYYTADRVVRTMRQAESLGINACVPLGNDFMLRVIRQYRNEGGRMHLIFQPYPAIPLEINLRMMLAANPLAIYHQGTTTDNLCETGRVQELRDNISRMRATGLPAGLGTHVPETILRAEAEDWGVDFYMACLYNARRTNRGEESGFITGKSKELVFYPQDRFAMLDVIREVRKPVIAFKLFAGGQVFLDRGVCRGQCEHSHAAIVYDVFIETFSRLKPTDMACIGVYQQHADQLAADVEAVGNAFRDL